MGHHQHLQAGCKKTNLQLPILDLNRYMSRMIQFRNDYYREEKLIDTSGISVTYVI